MRLIPADSIEVPANRQRREFDLDSLQELIQSIQETQHGLLHPIVVRSQDGRPVLVAGERRLRAIKDIYELGGGFRHGGETVGTGLAPVVELGDLSPLEAMEAELEENVRRRDLTVVELAMATAALYKLRAAQAQADGKPAPTTTDLARELFDIPDSKPSGAIGSEREAVRDQLLVARNAHNPAVRAAKSLKEAVKVVKKADEIARTARLTEAVGKTYSTQNLILLNQDSLHWMQVLGESKSFDIILSDPPYGMGAQDFSDSGKPEMGAHFYDDSYETWQKTMSVFAPASFALAKSEAHAYLFCDLDRFQELRERMSSAGWTVHRTPLVWNNPDGFRAPWPDRGPQRKYELILFAEKGGRKTTKLLGDVLVYRKDPQQGHPAQKPVELLKDLLQRSARPGDKVLDPFAGSGSTLEACHALKLSCVGLEQDAGAYGIALKRVQALKAHEEGLF